MPQIEYFGVNIQNGDILCEKVYNYITDTDPRPDFPQTLDKYLVAFDICSRSETKYSVSYFIKNRTYDFFFELVVFLNQNLESVIDFSDFFPSFSKLSHFENDSHYDPILSVQIEYNQIVKASFYVNTLPDKSLCKQFYTETVSCLGPMPQKVQECIDDVMKCNSSKMFLSSWDYEAGKECHHKIYLKVTEPIEFGKQVELYFPNTLPHLSKDNYKLSCIAFSFNKFVCRHLNIYFKPL